MIIIEQDLDESHLATLKWWTMEWAHHFGVDLRWHIRVTWEQHSQSAASIWYDDEAMVAIVYLDQKFKSHFPLDDEFFARMACHEILHLLLEPLAELADNALPRTQTSLGMEHAIVQTLMQISMRDHFDTMRARCPFKV
jgi:hypothetical protein